MLVTVKSQVSDPKSNVDRLSASYSLNLFVFDGPLFAHTMPRRPNSNIFFVAIAVIRDEALYVAEVADNLDGFFINTYINSRDWFFHLPPT